jgi:15,16-dihydrobiliverdin:ferredoxin oxidoreductase
MLGICITLLLTFISDKAMSLASSPHIDAAVRTRISMVLNTAAPVAAIDGTHKPLQPSEQMPWSKSVKADRDLTYMPLLARQIKKLHSFGYEEVNIKEDFIHQQSTVKPARIGNLCFRGGIFRKIRVTYFDAGDGVQVFNTLWYPKYEYDIPMLGVDLISLGLNRVLSVIDFQPLHPTEEYNQKYISGMKSLRDKYPDLQGVLSGKIYDDTSFFSKQMLFGRFTDESKVKSVVFPAFDDYLDAYLKLADSAVADSSEKAMNIVKMRQTEYDRYSALKDPAVGLFDAYFGKDWSKSFVHDFLFDLSTVSEATPVHNFKLTPQIIDPSSIVAAPIKSKSNPMAFMTRTRSLALMTPTMAMFAAGQKILDSAFAILPTTEPQ